jgi:hypothetical protein
MLMTEVRAVKKKIARLVVLALVTLLVEPGCATLLRRTTQRIPVTSSPAGATVSVNGEALGTTPLQIKLTRWKRKQIIRIESPGYNPFEIRAQRKIKADPVAGNLLFGLLVGSVPAAVHRHDHETTEPEGVDDSWLIWVLWATAVSSVFTAMDLGGGQAYEVRPKELVVTLTKVDGPPRVDTIHVDIDEFRDVKWIRVHRN